MSDLALLECEDWYHRAFTLSRTDPPAAWREITRLLERWPEHVEANILAGELALWDGHLILAASREQVTEETAESYFIRAIRLEPRHADAWSGLALARRYLGDLDGALQAVEQGIRCLDSGVGYLRLPIAVRYVGEQLYRTGVLAAWGLGRRVEARARLAEGLTRFPGSEYLAGCAEEISRDPHENPGNTSSG